MCVFIRPRLFQFHIKSHEEAKYPGSRGPRERTAVRVSRPARVKEPFRVQPERGERRGNAGEAAFLRKAPPQTPPGKHMLPRMTSHVVRHRMSASYMKCIPVGATGVFPWNAVTAPDAGLHHL